jgi:hypothetical protein
MSGLLLCLHMAFTVDRVEQRFAVVEWLGTVLTTDVSASLFPTPPTEGERWIIHLVPSPDGETAIAPSSLVLRHPAGVIDLPEPLSISTHHHFRLRMTRMSNTSTLGGVTL